ncbi:MAG TPA: hypothetical protein VKA88_06485 [Solirubrobacterales bacterium]|nr:hypothetical protein [Solirubrobacterales bacterium]
MTRIRHLLPAIAAAALLAVTAGCGADSSGQETTTAEVSIPSPTSPTSPIPTTTAATQTSASKKQKTTAKTTTATGGSSVPCSIPDAFQDFKFTGVDCASAVAVAQAWDSNGKDCNTVDNPNVDAGYNRTCSVEGFSCTAKRDVHSDARFVTCTQGGQSIRFTWLPA